MEYSVSLVGWLVGRYEGFAALEMRTCFIDNKSARLWDIVEVSNDPLVNFHDLGSRLNLLMDVTNDSLVNFHDLGLEII